MCVEHWVYDSQILHYKKILQEEKRPSDTAQCQKSCWWMLSVLTPPHVRAGRGESRAAPCWGHVPISPSSWGRFPFVKQGWYLAALGLGAKLSKRPRVSHKLTLPADTKHLQLLHRVSLHAAPSHAARGGKATLPSRGKAAWQPSGSHLVLFFFPWPLRCLQSLSCSQTLEQSLKILSA